MLIRRLPSGSRPSVFIAAGLFGAALYEITLRVSPSTLLGKDTVHGFWIGICVGIEILGLVLLRKRSAGA